MNAGETDWRLIVSKTQQLLSVAVIVAFTVGCSSEKSGGDGGSGGDKKARIPVVKADKLPPLGGYMGTKLDDGKLEVAPPDDWRFGARNSKLYLVKFDADAKSMFPAITVTARDSSASFRSVGKENIRAFAEYITKDATERKVSGVKTGVAAVVIGDKFCVTYTRAMIINKNKCDVQVIEVLNGDRIYSVNLRMLQDLDDDKYAPIRDRAYAVVAGLKFAATEAPADVPAANADGDTPDEEPAAEDANAAAEAK